MFCVTYLQGCRELLSVTGSITSTQSDKNEIKCDHIYALFRVSPQDTESNIEQQSLIFVVNILINFQEEEEKIALKVETAKDPELCST